MASGLSGSDSGILLGQRDFAATLNRQCEWFASMFPWEVQMGLLEQTLRDLTPWMREVLHRRLLPCLPLEFYELPSY